MKNFLILLLSVFVFSGCGSDDDDPSPTGSPIVGNWNISKFEEIEPDGTVNETDLNAGNVKFEANGKFTFNFQGSVSGGTYTYVEGTKKLTFTYTEDGGQPSSYEQIFDVVTLSTSDLVMEKKELSEYPGEEGIWTDRYEMKKQ